MEYTSGNAKYKHAGRTYSIAHSIGLLYVQEVFEDEITQKVVKDTKGIATQIAIGGEDREAQYTWESKKFLYMSQE